MRLIMIFVDGLGMGEPDPGFNPAVGAIMPFFNRMLGASPFIRMKKPHLGDGMMLAPLDATLGVPGLPQSATGQAALLSGLNLARIMGRHINGFPTASMRKILAERNLFLLLRRRGKRVYFANTYTPQYLAGIIDRTGMQSVTTVCYRAAGCPFNTLEDLKKNRSIYHDLTNEILIDRGYQVDPRDPAEAGHILGDIYREYDFVLFEHFVTDLAGHAQNMEKARELLSRLDEFMASLAARVDFRDTQLVLLSDHGNMEDLSTKTHTLNPVPVFAMGTGCGVWTKAVSLVDVTPLVMSFLCG
ncbi:MAG: alkaline phosphatase family protein [Bacillota bacterium]